MNDLINLGSHQILHETPKTVCVRLKSSLCDEPITLYVAKATSRIELDPRTGYHLISVAPAFVRKYRLVHSGNN